MSDNPNIIDRMTKLGTVLATYIFFIWIYQQTGDYASEDITVMHNYQTLRDFLISLNIQVTVPHPLDRKGIKDFITSLEFAHLLDRIQNVIDFSYGTQYGAAFLLATSATMYTTMYKVQSVRPDAVLVGLSDVSNDIRKISHDLEIMPSVTEEFLKAPFERHHDFIEMIKEQLLSKDRNNGVNGSKIEVKLENVTIYGDFAVAHSIKNSFNKVAESAMPSELQGLMKELAIAVGRMAQELPKEQAEDAAEDFKNLVEQVTRDKPKRKWWSVSVEGLTQAAKNIGEIGKPVLDILAKIVPLLTKISE